MKRNKTELPRIETSEAEYIQIILPGPGEYDFNWEGEYMTITPRKKSKVKSG